jgi:hypothetical protein
MFQKKYFLLVFLISHLNSFAQFQGNVYIPSDSGKVLHYGNEINSPFMGGMNSLQITMGDLNNDGKEDIVGYDYINEKIFPFINIGVNGSINYQYEAKYAKNFPYIFYYLFLKDYNCDGIPDLFHKGS